MHQARLFFERFGAISGLEIAKLKQRSEPVECESCLTRALSVTLLVNLRPSYWMSAPGFLLCIKK
ncbi:Uncharacterised protein [Vibrio cholerae]|nr:Uncharacterised protein [Vibrio cholerae]CSI44680.1 Uncharacterised protein [Vibrio cholerae]